MLLAQNISDIDLGIRRLCQTRLYMKQAPDSAFLAARELIFPGVESDKVIEKLKLLDSRVGALSFITRKGNEKIQEESILIRTEAFELPQTNVPTDKNANSNGFIRSEFKLTLGDGFDGSKSRIELRFLGEPIYRSPIKELTYINLVQNRKYDVMLLNEKGKEVAATKILGKARLSIFVDEQKIIEFSGPAHEAI
jgi:hypothetical protein